jgi:hypothetical protein
MSGHPPFGAQGMLKGHEYVACRAQKAGVGFTKQDNCFTKITDAAGLAQVADTLPQSETTGRLRQLCERWIYATCLCVALDLESQTRSVFSYNYSVFQMEYSAICYSSPDSRWTRHSRRLLIDHVRRSIWIA